MAEAYIVAAARTAGGRKGGRLKDWHPVDLGAEVINALLDRTGIDPARIDDVIWGCVGQAGEQATNVARNTVSASRLPESVPGTSVDRQCGSSQQALHFAAQAVMSGTQDVVIAGGVESMTRVPMGLAAILPQKNGFGFYKSPKMEERYPGVHFSQFAGAEQIAVKYDISKDEMDEFGYNSHLKAIRATKEGAFRKEIVPVEVTLDDGTKVMHEVDEGIRFDVTLEGVKGVKLLQEGGRITAATSSQICDGSAAVLVVNEKALKEFNFTPLARVHHMTVIGGDPVIMLETPIEATRVALKKAGMSINDIDLFEVNEAFASVPMAWLKELGADPERLNVNGGAIALGHPLGGSGAKLMTTLVHALHARGKRYGLQTMCEGGGLANVTIIERL
ncbi:acetyl-CoA C-acetyltransferase [Camelimonas abortus]|uniref:Acetyl-CoA C-acetyltransferase n=1 Tax=Camelimonas abortus TaxID=1017184 RepID=A0ABV7LGF9_9HYPH